MDLIATKHKARQTVLIIVCVFSDQFLLPFHLY